MWWLSRTFHLSFFSTSTVMFVSSPNALKWSARSKAKKVLNIHLQFSFCETYLNRNSNASDLVVQSDTMASTIDIKRVEDVIEYEFHDKYLIRKALKAASKTQDEETGEIINIDDGNRRLAQLGHKLLEFILLDEWYRAGSDRGAAHLFLFLTQCIRVLTVAESTNYTITTRTSNETLAKIAKRTGIDTCIVPCERQGKDGPSTKTLKLAVTAVIGAVWIDSDNISVTSQAARKLR